MEKIGNSRGSSLWGAGWSTYFYLLRLFFINIKGIAKNIEFNEYYL